ncbi:hypothetical protein MSAN_00354400 [Mycena sanguinolenta]|uniref:DUF6533 domain-containing protein n=1 Tax=Mycena sanguinolenta TaxID=230812 RepID=A0A8H7DGL4_9AGAR|nr:hypothetical protein MSAN_00354400 [Mycena sanguinolenta]
MKILLRHSLKQTDCMSVAGLVLLIHDIILTFPRYVELIWKRKVTTSSIMFAVMRHGNIIAQGIGLAYYLWPNPPYAFCKAWFYSEEWVSDVLFIPVSVFLALRTYALYRGEGAFYKWLIFGVVLSSNLALFVSLSLATAEVRFSPLPAPGLTCSFTISGPPNTAGLVQFIASTYFDFVIFGLSALRCWQHYKQGNVRIIKILFKSCLLYFVFLFTTGLASLIMYKTLPDARAELKGVLINPMRTAAVIITSRMVLNIRSIVWSDGPITTENLATPFDKTTVGSASLRWRVAPGQEDPMEFDEDEY